VSAALAALRARYKKYPAGYDSPKSFIIFLFNEVLHNRARSRVFSMPHQLRRTKRISFSYPTRLCESGEYGLKYYPQNQTVNEEPPVAGRGTV